MEQAVGILERRAGSGAGRRRRLVVASVRFMWSHAVTALSTAAFRFRLWLIGARVGSGARIHGWVRIHVSSSGTLDIGERLRINSGFANNPLGERMGIWIGPGASVTIGNNVAMSNSRIFAVNRIAIEDDAMIGGGCILLDSDYHPVDTAARTSPSSDHEAVQAPVIIGSGAFVGARVIVLKGVHVGRGSAIGAGSVQTKSIPPGEIWAGVPSKRISRIA